MGQANDQRWRERPVLGAALQAAVTITPLAAGVGVGMSLGRWVLPDRVGTVGGWAIAGAAAMTTVWLLQPLARRAVPLAWLLKLGMLWPGVAPSRFKIARKAGRVRDLEERLARARTHGLEGDAEHAAELILSLTAALTSHDRKTRGHAERVRVFTDLLAMEVGLSPDERDRLRWSALLHDIGKLEVPERVLNKPGKPSPKEWEQLKSHPEAGDRIMAPLRTWLGEWSEATLHHHERWDGKGYPNGLAGHDISRAGRIVAVADAYEVMTAARAYKRPMSAAAAREELVSCAGEQFDPAVVRMFLLVPLWRLRWALGPFAWVAQLPLARDVVHAGSSASALAPATGVAAGATAVLVGSSLTSASTDLPSPVDVEAMALGAWTSTDDQSLAFEQNRIRDDVRARTSIEPRGDRAAEHPNDTTPDGQPAEQGTIATPPEPSRQALPDGTDSTGEQAPRPRDPTGDSDGDDTGAAESVVDDATEAVGSVVDDVVDTADQVPDDATQALDDLIDDPAGSVGQVVDDTADDTADAPDDAPDDALDDALDDATDDPTGAAGQVVDDTADTLDEVLGTAPGILGG